MKTLNEVRKYDPDLEDRYDDQNRPVLKPSRRSKLAEAIKQVMKKVGKTDTGQQADSIELTPVKNELTTFHENIKKEKQHEPLRKY